MEKQKTTKRNKAIVLLFLGCLLIFLNISRGGGFSSNNSAEATGANTMSLIIWIASFVLVVKGLRGIIKKSSNDNNNEEKGKVTDIQNTTTKKDRALKISIISGVLIVILSIAYYLAIVLPKKGEGKSELQKQEQLAKEQKEQEALLFEKQTECKTICEKIYTDDKKSISSNSSYFEPHYAYNRERNSCFYSGGWTMSGGKLAENMAGKTLTEITKKVVNCQTNQTVLTFIRINDEILTKCGTCVNSSDEFDKKEAEYMGSNSN